MAKTTDVGSGQVVASTWGNEIRDRTNQLFASETERNSQWPAAGAPLGATSVTTDTGLRWQKVGTAWIPATGSVPTFADTATRDAKWPNAANGSQCVTTDTNTVWQRVNGAWQTRRASASGRFLQTAVQTTATQIAIDMPNSGTVNMTISGNKISPAWAGYFLLTANMMFYMPNANSDGDVYMLLRANNPNPFYSVTVGTWLMAGQWQIALSQSMIISIAAGQSFDFAATCGKSSQVSGGFYMHPSNSSWSISYLFP